MRSAIFKSFADLPKEFTDDLRMLWSLSQEQREGLIPAALELLRADTSHDHDTALEQSVANLGGEEAELLKALKAVFFICRNWVPFEDTPEAFIADLKSLRLLPEEGQAASVSFLLELLSALQEDNVRRMQKRYADATLPSYVGMSAVVDIRPVFAQPFGTRGHTKVEYYTPDFIGWVPVILVNMQRDTGLATSFEFQCDEDGARRMVGFLQAALKDLQAAKGQIGLED